MNTKKNKSPTEVHVYLDPDVYQTLATIAKNNDRSMTAQCRVILQKAIREEGAAC